MESYDIALLLNNTIDTYNVNLKLFEIINETYYPYGNDFFSISHGENYIQFFRRLGCVYYFIIISKTSKLIIGVACAVLRTYNNHVFWYLCDLKIDKQHRRLQLPSLLFFKMYPVLSQICLSGYCISMDPTSIIIAKIFDQITLNNINFCNIKTGPKIAIYTVNKNIFTVNANLFKNIFGDYTFLSLNGIKNLTLKSTNCSINIFHLQHGIFADNNGQVIDSIPDNAECMFCIPYNTQAIDNLANINIISNVSATIFYRNMDYFNWKNILTSDI